MRTCNCEQAQELRKRIAELEKRVCKKHIAFTMRHPCEACGQDWKSHAGPQRGLEE